MPLEPRALLLVVTVLALLFALQVLMLWWTRRTYPGFHRWTAAGILLLAALCLFALRKLVPDWAGVVFANGAIILASILYLEGARQFVGLLPRKWLAYAAGTFTVIAVAFFDYVAPSVNARGSVVSTFTAIIFLFTSRRLLQAVPPQHKFGLRLTGGMFALCAALLLARAVYFQFSPPLNDSTVYLGISGALFVAVSGALVCIGLGFVLLADERALSDLYDARESALRATLEITERKQAEAALRDSEERLKLAQDAAQLGVWDTDLRTDVITISGKYAQLHGLPPGRTTITREEWFSLIHPDDRERVAELRREAREQTHTFEAEFRVRWLEGSVHWLRAKGRVLLDDSGRPTRTMGVIEDVTQRKQAESALRESEGRFRTIADAAPVMIWRSGPDKLCNFFNKPWLDFRGRSMEQEQNNGWAEGIHPEDLDRCLDTYSSSFDARLPFRMEYRLRRADGEYRWVLDQGIPLYRESEFTGYIGSCVDVSERKLIEERLRASEARLLSAQRLANLGCWERDDVTGTTEFSDEMLRILGMPDNPPRTLAEFLDYVHSEDRKYVSEGALRARSTGESVTGEYRIVRTDGEVRFVHSILEAIRDERGAVIRVVGATQDITSLKRAQEESAARQKLESVGTLASGIAHDFNNLLGGVLAQAELGLAELEAGSNPDAELRVIRDVALRGSEIVRELMIYAGKESSAGELVDVSQTVEEMLELLKISVSKHASVKQDLGAGLPPIHANSAQVRQIVMNLVMNASEAIGDRDGVIHVTTRCVRMDRDRLPTGDYVQLEVSDTGQGMTEATQAKVFDPFFTTKSAGHGLGLAVVQGIVRGLHGAIHLTSEPGKGTSFQVLLPPAAIVFTGTSGNAISETEPPVRPTRLGTVLVVEDEDALRQAVTKMLAVAGFEVLEARNGSSAIDLLRRTAGRIDAILLDITIPGASSSEVVSEAAKIRPDIHVILTSAYSEDMIAGAGSASQIRGFIRKPFQITDLVKALRDTLSS